MMLHLKRWLAPPVFPDDEDKTRRASALNVALIITLPLLTLILVGNVLGSRTPLIVSGADVAGIIVCLIVRRWMRQGRVRLASAALIGVDLVCITVADVALGTVRTPTTALYLLLVAVGGLLFDVGGIVVTTVLSSLAIFGLIVAENAGLLPRPDYTVTITQWIAYTALSGFSGGLTFVALQSTRRALQRADREIAERKRVEEALRDSEARYRRLVEGSPDIVYVFSDRRGGLYYSSSTESTLGYSPAYLCAHPFLWNESIHADDRAHVTRAIREFAAGQAFDVEYRVRDAGGKWHWLRDRSIGRRIENGEALIEGLATDITDRKQAEEALRASEQIFRSFVEQSSEGFTLVDEQGAIIEWNRAREQMTGLTRDRVVGRPFWDVQREMLPPDEQADDEYERRKRAIQDALRTGESRLFNRPLDSQIMKPDGDRRFFQQTVFPIKTERGYRIGSVTRDVTERWRAEQALLQSRSNLQTILDNFPFLVWLKDTAGRFVAVNEPFARAYGTSPDELIDKTDLDIRPPEVAEGYRADDTEVMRSRQKKTVEELVADHGAEKWFETFKAPLFDLTGKVMGTTGFARDITGRKRADETLRETNERMRALIDHSPLSIIVLDPEGVVLLWNAAAEKMYGWTAQEAVGKFLPTVSAEKMAEHQAVRNHVNSGHSIPYTEVVRKRKDGSDIFLGLSVAPLKDAAGNVYAQMSIAADITERKRAEEALHALNAELEQRVAERTRELTDANARLTELDRLKDEFISRISHELRTPLTNIKLYLQLLGHGKPEKHEQYLQTVQAEADKLQQQIDDLLEVSSLQTTRIEPHLLPLDVNRLVQDLFADQLAKAQARGLTLSIAAEVEQPNVTSDWALVWQALSRLMANALAYTPRGGAVMLHTDRCTVGDQAWLTIEVRDTGPGISDKDLPHIFEPFYRGAAASDYKTPGTGVGLSLARRTIEQLGGRITVDSQPGRGSAFTIWLRAE